MKHILSQLSLTFISLLTNFNVLAASGETSDSTGFTGSPVNTGALVETLLGLILVLIIIAFLAWLLRRTNSFNSSANGQMKIIAGLALGPRERAVLLQVGEQQILVGVTAQQVQTLHVLDTPLDVERTSESSTKFSERLQHIMQQRSS